MNEPHSGFAVLNGIPPEDFAGEVFESYSRRLLQVAEDRLAAKLRPKISPEDIVQSAFKSFFRRLGSFHLDHDAPKAIWGLLVVITIRKCRKWEDIYYADKRNVHREFTIQQHGSAMNHELMLLDKGPGPEEIMVVTELVEQLLSRFEPRRREMLILRLHGYELNEIAQQCCSSRRTVARTVADARDFLAQILDRTPDTP